MGKYLRKYLLFGALAILFMVGEVTCDLLQPRLMQSVIDDGVLRGAGVSVILRLGGVMILAALLGCACGAVNGLFAQTAAQRIGNDIRKDAMRKILRFSSAQMKRHSVGALVTRVTGDITQISSMCNMAVRGLVRTLVQILGSLFFLFAMDPRFAGIVLTAMPVLLLVIFLCLRRVSPLFTRMQEELDAVNALLSEDLSGIRIIKACVREAGERARFGRANGKLTDTQLSVLLVFAALSPAANAILYGTIAALLFVGRREVAGGLASPGQVMAAVTYVTQLLNAILRLVMMFQNISRGAVSWRRLEQVLSEEEDMPEGEAEQGLERGSVAFRGVSFSWEGSERRALSHIFFEIRPGETVGIMGATGSGKSTLVSLIPRFYDAGEGTVLVDGRDVRAYTKAALREKIAFALQGSELFGRTIRENIAWGNPGASEAEIRAAAEAAQADGFIRSLPGGYGAQVAQRGMNLSGGQKQRLAVARALARHAEILILDDATSALDLATEAALYEAVNRLRPGMTKIIVAQRAASVRHADQILFLEEGRLTARGTHRQLMESCPAYREIVSLQMGEEAAG